jgi:hypothetical protein
MNLDISFDSPQFSAGCFRCAFVMFMTPVSINCHVAAGDGSDGARKMRNHVS